MGKLNKLTGIALMTTGEGDRVAYTYSVIDDEGNLISPNNKGNFIALDAELISHIQAIRNFVNTNKLSKMNKD